MWPSVDPAGARCRRPIQRTSGPGMTPCRPRRRSRRQADPAHWCAAHRGQRVSRPSVVWRGESAGTATVRSTNVVSPRRLGPAPRRGGPTWAEFLRAQAEGIISCDFFSVETAWLRTLYVLVFIELGSRRIHVSPSTAHPDSTWVTQQARNLALGLDARTSPVRFLIRDHDAKFSTARRSSTRASAHSGR